MPESLLRITGRTANRVRSKHAIAMHRLKEAVSDLTPGELHELARFLSDPLVVEWFGVRAQLAARLEDAGGVRTEDAAAAFNRAQEAYYHTRGRIVTVDLEEHTL